MNISHVGQGEVVLIAGGGKCYTDIAARFCNSNRSLEEILASPYDAKLVKNILGSGHLAASEFDYFLFGVTGYARVTEVQLVRKRIASYLISSGRDNRNGKRDFEVVLPDNVEQFVASVDVNPNNIFIRSDNDLEDIRLTEKYPELENSDIYMSITAADLLNFCETWYNTGVDYAIPEEDLRYMKPQATMFKAIIGMDSHALLDWFMIRTCMRAQTEIHDLACKMMSLCKNAQPDLFSNAGPSCVRLGYCPENGRQHASCKEKGIITKKEALEVLKKYKNNDLVEKPEAIKLMENIRNNIGSKY